VGEASSPVEDREGGATEAAAGGLGVASATDRAEMYSVLLLL